MHPRGKVGHWSARIKTTKEGMCEVEEQQEARVEAQGPVWNQKKRNVCETLAISQEDR